MFDLSGSFVIHAMDDRISVFGAIAHRFIITDGESHMSMGCLDIPLFIRFLCFPHKYVSWRYRFERYLFPPEFYHLIDGRMNRSMRTIDKLENVEHTRYKKRT